MKNITLYWVATLETAHILKLHVHVISKGAVPWLRQCVGASHLGDLGTITSIYFIISVFPPFLDGKYI
jgi:hypothetical protein